jgi:hypothetical protein
MGVAAQVEGDEAGDAGVAARPAEVHAALERALAAADADERVGPMIAATKLRMRFEFTDSGLFLNVAVDEGDGSLRWWTTEEDEGWRPQFSLCMGSEVANGYLLGRQSLAIAIARGQARVRGGSSAALLCLPVTRLIREAYRRVVQADFPALAR